MCRCRDNELWTRWKFSAAIWQSVRCELENSGMCVLENSINENWFSIPETFLAAGAKWKNIKMEEENGTDDKNQTAMLSRTDTHSGQLDESLNKCQASKSCNSCFFFLCCCWCLVFKILFFLLLIEFLFCVCSTFDFYRSPLSTHTDTVRKLFKGIKPYRETHMRRTPNKT